MRIYLVALLLTAGTACSQSTETQAVREDSSNNKIEKENVSDKFSAARTTFQEKYPAAESVEWNEDDHGYHEADFRMDGEKYRADFNADGSWVETENTIKYKNLPDAIQKAIERDYDKDEITEIEHVKSAEKGEFFDVEFKQKGKNHDVMFTADGTVIGETNKK